MRCTEAQRILIRIFSVTISIPGELLSSRARFRLPMARPNYFYNCTFTSCPKLGEVTPALNTGLAKVAFQCSADRFVVKQSLVLRINICGENRHLRQARKRQDVKKLRFSAI
jgi:hypothetical protein